MKIRKYIYSLLITKTFVSTFILAAILWIAKVLKLLDTVAVKGFDLNDFLKLSACLIPYIVYLILPFATLISFAIVYRILDQDNELLVMKLSGMTKTRFIAPFLEVFIILAMFGLLISFYLIPASYQKFQEIIYRYQNYYLTTFIDAKSFNSDISGLTFYINKKEGDRFEGVFINDHRSKKKEISIFAESGELKIESNTPVFKLYNGMQFERSTNPSSPNSASTLKFNVYNLVFDYTRALKNIRGIEHRELGVKELLKAKDTDETWRNIYRSEGIKRIFWPNLAIVLPMIFLSIAFNMKFSRKTRYIPLTFAFSIPFALVLINIYVMGFAKHSWPIMLWICAFNFLILLISYIVASTDKLSF